MRMPQTGESTEKSISQILAKVLEPGTLFTLFDKSYFTIGVDKVMDIYYVKKGAKFLDIKKLEYEEILDAVEKGSLFPIVDEDYLVVDENLLKDEELERFYRLKECMMDIVRLYGPHFSYLNSKKTKDDLRAYAKECGLTYRVFREKINRFFTSGMKSYALLSKRSEVYGDKRRRDKKYDYKEKPGRKAKDKNGNSISQGVIVTKDMENQMLPFVDLVLTKNKTTREAFTRYNQHMELNVHSGVGGKVLKAVDERPTYHQFNYLVKKHVNKKDKLIAQKGYFDYYNDYRPLDGDTITVSGGPGDIVEIDAWEADVSLVRRNNRNEVISRPTLYLMVDSYTKMIVAYSIGFEVNSYIGASSLFMNLVEDKYELLQSFGYNPSDEMVPFPDPFIPNIVVTDNGSDFKSKDFANFLQGIGVEHQIAPPRAGSAKGNVERTFAEFSKNHIDGFAGYGLITTEYNSKHHEEACMTLEEYEKQIVLAIVYHNLKHMKAYPYHDIELLEKDVPTTPMHLWNFYTKHKGNRPRPVVDKKAYYFSLMKEVTATINRNGIEFDGLLYSVGSDDTLRELQAKDKSTKKRFRMDPRDVSRLYYLDNGELLYCSLNLNKAQNLAVRGFTYPQYQEFKKNIKDQNRLGNERNENLDVITNVRRDVQLYETIENNRLSSFGPNYTKNIKENRKMEKHERAAENRIFNKINGAYPIEEYSAKEIDNQKNYLSENHSYDELLEQLEDY